MKGRASTPGQFRPNFFVWVRCCPGQAAFTVLPAVFFMGLLALAFFKSGASSGIWGLAALSGLGAAARLNTFWQKCAQGDVNPAIVVSTQPCLVAVSTDMSKNAGDTWPVIKILPQPLARAWGKAPQIGDRLPMVSLYEQRVNSPHWDDFSPVAIACLTGDADMVREAMRRLSANEFGPDHWQRLSDSLARVPQPYRPGLYWI